MTKTATDKLKLATINNKLVFVTLYRECSNVKVEK